MKKQFTSETVRSAHRLARQARAAGYDYRASFAQAMRDLMAAPAQVTVELIGRRGRDKVWVAKILGVGGPFGFEREFVDMDCVSQASRREIRKNFTLEKGTLYETNDRDGRYFLRISPDGETMFFRNYNDALGVAA